jgi:hypothetical protein
MLTRARRQRSVLNTKAGHRSQSMSARYIFPYRAATKRDGLNVREITLNTLVTCGILLIKLASVFIVVFTRRHSFIASRCIVAGRGTHMDISIACTIHRACVAVLFSR